MSEPTDEAYEAAWYACNDVRHTDVQAAVRAAVDAVWALAKAEGRREAAAAIRAEVEADRIPRIPLRSGTLLRPARAYEHAAQLAEGVERRE